MMPLFDMMMNAQGGQGVDALARQFGLSQEQARQAMEALMPAFSQGLKRNATDPMGLGALMQAFAQGGHQPFYDNPSAAFGSAGVDAGNDVLGQIFGSKDVSRAVAAHAAQATGIGQEILKQMLPILASMMMGGLAKQTTNAASQGTGQGTGNVFTDMLTEMMRQAGGGASQTQQQPQMPNVADNPFGRMFEDMLKGFGMPGAQAPAEPTPQEPPTNPSGRPRNTYDDLFGQMFDTGREVRDQYQKGVESIFDQYLGGMDKNR